MIRRLLLILALLASLGAAAAPQLLVPYNGPVTKSAQGKPFKSEGSRIQFNLAALRSLVPGQEAELTLPDGTRHAIVLDLVQDKGEAITTWIGHYASAGDTLRTVITTGPGGTFGRIVTPDNEYSIVPGEGHDWLVDMKAEKPFVRETDLRHDSRHAPPHGKAAPVAAEPGIAAEAVEVAPGVNSPALPKSAAAIATPPLVTIDVLFVYTTGLKNALGAGLQTRFQQLIASANTTYADSGVGVTLRMVGSTEVSYTDGTESFADMSQALDDITPNGAAVAAPFANIESLRAQYGADVVTLLRNGDQFGGIGLAWVPTSAMGPSWASFMYSVVSGCTVGCDWVWVHEIGHNMGNAHDRGTNAWENNGANSPGSYSYSYGYYSCQGGNMQLSCNAFAGQCGAAPECSTSVASTNNFSDIMAYFQGSTVKNIVFSNPAISCHGNLNQNAPCGSAPGNADEANAALTINNNRTAMAALFATKVGAATTTALVASPNPSTAGQGVTFTATVTSPSGTPAGSVAFSVDGGAVAACGAVALASGVATCGPVTSLAAGAHTITAQYAGSTAFNASTGSVSQTVNVAKVTPSVGVGVSPNPPTAGQTVTLSANVSGANGTATGTVTFAANGTTLCANAGVNAGTATCVTSALAAGSQAVSASYSGNSAYNAASGSGSFFVRGATTVFVTSSTNPATSGQPVTFTATLSSALAGTFTGTLTFTANGTAIGACTALSVSGPTVACTTAGLPLGDNAIAAQYSGSASFAPAATAAIAQSVRANSGVVLATSLTPANLRQPVTFTATITGTGAAPSGSVAFKDGASPINGCGAASVSNGIAKCVTSGLASGSHSITAAYSGDTSFFASTSSAITQAVTMTMQAPPAGGAKRLDFNGDGKSDIVWQRDDGSVSLWLMDGTSIAARGQVFGPSAGAVTRAGDFNGDGKVDFVRQLADGSTSITYMNGLDVIAGGPVLRGPTSARLINVGDFNGDGITDLVWRNADNSVELWLMSATAAPAVTTIMPPGTGWSVAKIGDFNGDRLSDILWSNVDGTTSLWLMSGATVLQRGALMPAGRPWRVAWVGDFDNDGRDDIIWVNTTDGSVSMWLMDGLAALQRGSLMGANSGWSVSLVGDFNGDGNADIVWTHPNGSVTLWLMSGLIAGSQVPIFGAGAPWTPTEAIDANGDGNADFLWTRSDGTVGLWLMNGATALERRTVMNPTTVWSLATTVEQNR